jgi:hypothetical protein
MIFKTQHYWKVHHDAAGPMKRVSQRRAVALGTVRNVPGVNTQINSNGIRKEFTHAHFP